MYEDTELAWAAGFFDGEGSTFLHNKRGKTGSRYQPRTAISQKDVRPLERFQRAVGGLGRIRYAPTKGMHSLQFQCIEDSRRVIALIWPYLSEPKREQATRVFEMYDTFRWLRENTARNRCKRGHLFEESSSYFIQSEDRWSQRCQICIEEGRHRRSKV